MGKPAGGWREVFGPEADEAFKAYATAHYIEQVAAAGKRAYDMPMYVNTWLRYKGKRYPGVDYPSGGATVNVFDLAATTAHAANFGQLAPLQRIIAKAAFEGRLQAVAEQPGQPKRTLHFGDWEVRVSYGAPYWGDADPILPGNADHGGRMLVVQTAADQFLLTGFSARAELVRVANDALHGQLLRVEQGRYVNGQWQFERLLNGDQTDYGLNFVREDPPVLRVTVGSY